MARKTTRKNTRKIVRKSAPAKAGSAAQAELDLVGVAAGQESEAVIAAKGSFPAADVAQTAAVMAVLASASVPQDAISIASSFKQGRRNLPKVEAVLAALTRMGFVASNDGGNSFTLHRGT